jgi:inner membrane transporter RhtA
MKMVKAFAHINLVLAGIGICSSVIPYVCDQHAMSRLPRALLLALLPATATIIAAIVLAQIPSRRDIIGIVLVMRGVALHKPAAIA